MSVPNIKLSDQTIPLRNDPRMTTFLSGDNAMYQAYNEGKDLYAMIAQSAFNNRYEDNLEYYVPGEEVDIDGKTVIAGNEKEYYAETDESNSITVKSYELVPTSAGAVAASDLKIGDFVLTEGDEKLIVKSVNVVNDNATIIFE